LTVCLLIGGTCPGLRSGVVRCPDRPHGLDVFVRGVSAILDERARRVGETAVTVRIASDGVAEGAAQLVLAPLFGRADG
jgi:hypothetical protein